MAPIHFSTSSFHQKVLQVVVHPSHARDSGTWPGSQGAVTRCCWWQPGNPGPTHQLRLVVNILYHHIPSQMVSLGISELSTRGPAFRVFATQKLRGLEIWRSYFRGDFVFFPNVVHFPGRYVLGWSTTYNIDILTDDIFVNGGYLVQL